MSDNTTLDAGAGGDVIKTDEIIVEATGLAGPKAQVVKLMLGGDGIDGGLIAIDNPVPVEDRSVLRALEKISRQLDELIEAIENI